MAPGQIPAEMGKKNEGQKKRFQFTRWIYIF